MSTFFFEVITPDQALNFTVADSLRFVGQSASATTVSVAYSGANVVMTFDGMTVTFGPGFSAVTRSLFPTATNLLLTGTPEQDTLTGGDGADVLLGGAGADILRGGTGADRLTGGLGDDTFVIGLRDSVLATMDTILDFQSGDKLFFANGLVGLEAYQEASYSTFTEAQSRAMIEIESGRANVFVAAVGARVFVFVDSGNQNLIADAVALENVALGQIDRTNFVDAAGNTGTPQPPPPPSSTPTDGADLLVGTSGADTIDGLDGNDTISGGAGNDLLDGGTGLDVVSYETATSGVTISLRDFTGQGGDLGVDTLRNFEGIFGSPFNDSLVGSASNDTISGGGGDDTIAHFNGSDTISGGAGNDRISAGQGVLTGDAGNDTLTGAALSGRPNDLTISGGLGDDFITGSSGFLFGNDGNDTISIGVSVGPALIEGAAGADSLSGGTALDTLRGGDGDDTISGGLGADQIVGGAGADRIVVSFRSTGVVLEHVDAVLDWSPSDVLVFGEGRVQGLTYMEASAGSYAAALSLANAAIGNGSTNFVAVAVGEDVFVFSDSENDNFQADDAIRLMGRGLDDISTANLVAGSAPAPTSAPGAEGILGGNMDSFRLAGLLNSFVLRADETRIEIGDAPYKVNLDGRGFTYAGDQITGGTVTGINYTQDAAPFFMLLRLSATLPVIPFLVWVANDANLEALSTILAFSDTLGGSIKDDLIRGFTGDDIIQGLGGADSLFGGAGNDKIYAIFRPGFSGGTGAGPSYLRGEEGDDSVTGGPSFDDANGNMGNDTVSTGAGEDYCVGGKDNDSLSGGADYDLVYGNLGDDTCNGDDGDDVVRGGQGADLVNGGNGADFVSGDKGDDTMTGGAGADIFHTFGDAGIDRVTDFSLAQGDRVQLDPGTQYTVTQAGADTVINMTGGGQMILVGVTLSSLTPGWIFGA